MEMLQDGSLREMFDADDNNRRSTHGISLPAKLL
ncbi:MAG: hypothetical protein CM15mP3_10750 [Candidatus Poseidoniales archaeon]|nr:MAG: hypothetical protein CM15mP3_10750 [Candidatus Poseidoniales archaeon]